MVIVCFSGIFGTGWIEDWKITKDKLIDDLKLCRFRGKLHD